MGESPYRKKPLWFRISQYTMAFVLTLIIIGLTAGFIGVGAVAGFVASLVEEQPILTKAEMARDIQQFTQTSYLFDRNGNPIGSGELRTANNRDLVELDDVSPYIIDAFISTEDKDFYEHKGIVPRSVLRAAYQDVTGSSTTTGGSTITQQLVKLSVLQDSDQTYMRKAREIFLALRLERLFDKDDILTSYLNRIYFGQGASNEHLYGIETAATGIFGVSAKDVNLAQAAYLAGIPQRPNDYSPFNEETLQAGLERQHTVLRRMLDNGKITEDEYAEAKAYDIVEALAEPVPYTYEQYPYLFEAIRKRAAEVLMKLDGVKPEQLQPEAQDKLVAEYYTRLAEGGYRIHSTIDLELYDALNKAVREYHGYKADVEVEVKGIDGKLTAKEQIGSAVIDVNTGALLAFVGGRDDDNIRNRALDAYKQPGSSAKPLLAYGPGMASGVLQPGTILRDTPEVAEVRGHTVSNYANNFHGNVTVREALKRSYNVAAIDAFQKVGLENGYDFIAEMNMDVAPEYRVPVGVLGVNGFSPEQMAGAYAMFANRGEYNETYLISRIEDAKGSTVYEHDVQPKRVMSAKSAYLLTDVLRDVLNSGTGTWIRNNISTSYDIAGKTGTTQNAKDVWFVGYTPEIAMSVWIGYDYEQTTPVVRPNENLARIMWTKLFHTLQEAKPDLSPPGSQFKQPDGLVRVSICKDSGLRAEGNHPPGAVYSELFDADHLPSGVCKPKKRKQEKKDDEADESNRTESESNEATQPGRGNGNNNGNGNGNNGNNGSSDNDDQTGDNGNESNEANGGDDRNGDGEQNDSTNDDNDQHN